MFGGEIMSINRLEGFNNIYVHHRYFKELTQIFKKERKISIEYRKWLMSQLIILDEDCDLALQNKEFEKLKNSGTIPPTCSIRCVRKYNNVRTLYVVWKDEDTSEKIIVLLTAFTEREKDAYQKALDCIKNRIKEIREEYQL